MNDFKNHHRTQVSLRVMQVMFATVCLIVLGRVFYLQVIEYEKYSLQGERNSIRQEIIPSARGLIYDRKGELLVSNEPIFTLTVNPATYDTSNNQLLAELLGVDVSQVSNQINIAQRYSWYRSSPFYQILTSLNSQLSSKICGNYPVLVIKSKVKEPTLIKLMPHIFLVICAKLTLKILKLIQLYF